MYLKTLITLLILNVVFVLIAIPLILRKIPRNFLYGFRVKATLENDDVWYAVNEFFGWGFLIASLMSSIGITLLFTASVLSPSDYMNISLVCLIAPQAVVILLTLKYMRTILDQSREEARIQNSQPK
jgi:hypothetical protein